MPIARLGMLLLLLLARCNAVEPSCSPMAVATIPLRAEASLLIVPAGINDHWVHLLVDTGAERTMLSATTAERLGLPAAGGFQTRYTGVGGSAVTTDVALNRLVLGGVHFPLEHVAVGALDTANQHVDIDGLLGADILLAFDLDIDVVGGTLTLYRSRACADEMPPWSEASIAVAGVSTRKDRLLLPIEIDGIRGQAVLDTGAQRSVLGAAMAERMGLTQAMLARDPPIHQHGVGPSEIIARLHTFHSLRIGPVLQSSPQIAVLPSEAGFGDALIGEDFLQGRRTWLSFRQRRVFVTRGDTTIR